MSEEIYSTSRWKPFEYRVDASRVITMELKRQAALEARAFRRALTSARSAFLAALPGGGARAFSRSLVAPGPDAPDEEKLAFADRMAQNVLASQQATWAWLDALPTDVIADVFNRCVRNVRVVVDGVDVDGGAGLVEIADDGLLSAVLNRLDELCTLSEQEGKVSASPSTSAAVAAQPQASTACPATSTEGEASISTATEISAEPVLSIDLE